MAYLIVLEKYIDFFLEHLAFEVHRVHSFDRIRVKFAKINNHQPQKTQRHVNFHSAAIDSHSVILKA